MAGKAFVGNAADVEQVKSAGRKERDVRKVELGDIGFLLSVQEGRRFLWRMMKMAGIYEEAGSLEAAFLAYREGRRGLGLSVLGDIMESNPKAFLEMMQEASKEEEKLG